MKQPARGLADREWRAFRRRGTAMVEFAVGAGFLLAVFSGVFEYGLTLFEYNKLETAATQGARYASIAPYDSSTATPSAAFLSAVQNEVLYGSPGAGNSPVVGGLTANNVALTVTFGNGVPSSMTVTIVGYTIGAGFGSHTLVNKPQITFPYLGIWAPA